MAGTANRLLENASLVDHLVGPVPEVIRHDPQMQALPRLDLVLVVPDVLRFAGPQLPFRPAVEPSRFLGDDQVPSLGLDAGPNLIDPRAIGNLTADLGLGNDVDHDLLRLPALGQVRLQERPAGGHLVIDTRTGRSVPTPANDHKSLTGMDLASGIAENPRPSKTVPKESRPLRLWVSQGVASIPMHLWKRRLVNFRGASRECLLLWHLGHQAKELLR